MTRDAQRAPAPAARARRARVVTTRAVYGRSQARRLSPGAAGRPRWIQGDRKLGACRRVRRVARVRVLRADTMRSDQVMSLGRVILVL
ncbi:hypothetical protein DKM05_15355 [Mycobacterium tuberculosis variant bovis]|uniref:Uncharacterized protein n=1 Tax=Mycobacterium tuberculosis TaxID=1773 RepID=A0AB73YBC1_MYCTX|nr:hypothetical protein B7R63_20295 [Mycobacterium tuberculosis]AVK92369.1 hypothetical protein C1D11_20080 [Mycobacterium tuberculosis variant bovis]EFD11307.1 conserved hypothetical protein [Mycobacterium tuberculosis T46]EFD63858.1 predicted protein [Mycobacterium tuberculosis EAS054]PRH99437.1 hypothetical protein B8A28_03035 [Mycobacterium tuberculosis variant caprae]WJH77857.1 hypothetical protein FF952_20275 [Mycobacterium tuberculosis complex sp. N0072]WJH86061.1 hypothetical protein 